MLLNLTFTLNSTKEEIKTKLYDKRHDLSFPMNFLFISNSSIPAAPAYEVYI